jgi:hypothetical protein
VFRRWGPAAGTPTSRLPPRGLHQAGRRFVGIGKNPDGSISPVGALRLPLGNRTCSCRPSDCGPRSGGPCRPSWRCGCRLSWCPVCRRHNIPRNPRVQHIDQPADWSDLDAHGLAPRGKPTNRGFTGHHSKARWQHHASLPSFAGAASRRCASHCSSSVRVITGLGSCRARLAAILFSRLVC